MRLAKKQGWEGLELDAERPHAAPMDLSADDRKRLRDVSGEAESMSAVSPNCDLSSPVPVQREAMICYVRECIKLAHDFGSPICKIFAAWRGITVHDGLATYDETYGYNQYGYWKRTARVRRRRHARAVQGGGGLRCRAGDAESWSGYCESL